MGSTHSMQQITLYKMQSVSCKRVEFHRGRGIFHGSMIIESLLLAYKPIFHRYLIISELAVCQLFFLYIILLTEERSQPFPTSIWVIACNCCSSFHFQAPLGHWRSNRASQGSTVTWRLWTSVRAAAGPMTKPSNSRGRAERRGHAFWVHLHHLQGGAPVR